MKKEQRLYLKYLKEHIENVQLVWEKLQEYCDNEFWLNDCTYFYIDSLVQEHDKSKYTIEEFNAYRQYFYPANNKEENLKYFNKAWNIHQKNNKHHWQYWVLIEDTGEVIATDMQFEYIIELLCDWAAMSIKFKNTPSSWYFGNKKNIIISKQTQSTIERWLPLFDKVYNSI